MSDDASKNRAVGEEGAADVAHRVNDLLRSLPEGEQRTEMNHIIQMNLFNQEDALSTLLPGSQEDDGMAVSTVEDALAKNMKDAGLIYNQSEHSIKYKEK
jgi:hypothetical protein